MKLFEKGELKVLWLFYLSALLSGILFFAPIFFVLYFRSLALSFFQISILIAIMPLASLISEIPTGAVADLYGRKFSHLLGILLQAICFLSLLFIKSYYGMLLIFAFLGISATFSSGASEAWVVDLVKGKNKKIVHNFFIKERSLYMLGHFVSGFIGAFAVKNFGLSIIWPVTAIAFMISFVILIFAEEHHIKKKRFVIKESFSRLYEQTKTSLKYTKQHSVLLYFILGSMIFMFTTNFTSDISWIPLLKGMNFPDYAFGYLWSAMSLMGLIAPFVSKSFMKNRNERKLIVISTALIGISSVLILFAYNIPAAVLLLLLSIFLFNFKMPIERTYIHKFVLTPLRATIISVESMAISIATLIALPIVGLLIDKIGARYTIAISGIILIPAIICYLKIREKK